MRSSRRAVTGCFFAIVSIALGVACSRPGGDQISKDFETVPSADQPVRRNSAAAAPKPASAATGSASAATSSSAAPAASSAAAPTASVASNGKAPTKKGDGKKDPGKKGDGKKKPPAHGGGFSCGDKGKPDCPMQRWMKSVAGSAVFSGDNAKMARVFDTIGAHAPPGMSNWAGISAAGAAKARAGDFKGSKRECKHCHTVNKSRYHAAMRAMKWP